MKIEAEFIITGRGHGLATDQAFTASAYADLQGKKILKVNGDDRAVELEILSVQPLLRTGGQRFIAFLVPKIEDTSIRSFLIGREVELT